MNAAEQLIEQGRAECEQKGLARCLATALSARVLALSELGRARLASCCDVPPR